MKTKQIYIIEYPGDDIDTEILGATFNEKTAIKICNYWKTCTYRKIRIFEEFKTFEEYYEL